MCFTENFVKFSRTPLDDWICTTASEERIQKWTRNILNESYSADYVFQRLHEYFLFFHASKAATRGAL